MDETLESRMLEFEKSSFIIDLMKSTSRKVYISIEQVVRLPGDKPATSKINLNASVIDDIIEVLQNYSSIIEDKKSLANKRYFSKEKKEQIEKRYLKGVSSKDLALQFACSEGIIEQILRNRGIELVSNEVPKFYKFWRRKKGK